MKLLKLCFESEEDYYQPVKSRELLNDKCIKFESNNDRYKNLAVSGYLNEIYLQLIDFVDNLKDSNKTWKI